MIQNVTTWVFSGAVLVGLPAVAGAQDSRPDPTELFKQLDTNKDGSVEPDEIPGDRGRFFERLVRIGDKDDNGRLTQEEFLEAFDQDARPRRDRDSGEPDRRRGRFAFDASRAETMFDRLDENKDGKLEAEEATGRGKRMVEFVLRRAGKPEGEPITKEEFVNLLKQRGEVDARFGSDRRRPPEGRGPFGPPLFFRKLDIDQDGKLSREELAKAAALIDEFDRNQDGALEPGEMFGFGRPGAGRRDGERRGPAGDDPSRPAAEARPDSSNRPESADAGPRSEAAQQKRFQKLDKNADGRISEDEAPERMKSRFARIDKNSDGAIDQSEFQARGKKTERDATARQDKKKAKNKQPDQNPGGQDADSE